MFNIAKKIKKMNILIINGPNLNLLGKREPSIYGNSTFEDYFSKLKEKIPEITLEYYQSNIEGQIIDKIQEYGFTCQGIILNAGGYTHTSVAIRDAIAGIKTPVVEVHISNTLSRENFRHQSIIGPVCKGCIMGFGLQSYDLAVEYFINQMD
jgi:3-dehydroquinate dehydratase-2